MGLIWSKFLKVTLVVGKKKRERKGNVGDGERENWEETRMYVIFKHEMKEQNFKINTTRSCWLLLFYRCCRGLSSLFLWSGLLFSISNQRTAGRPLKQSSAFHRATMGLRKAAKKIVIAACASFSRKQTLDDPSVLHSSNDVSQIHLSLEISGLCSSTYVELIYLNVQFLAQNSRFELFSVSLDSISNKFLISLG